MSKRPRRRRRIEIIIPALLIAGVSLILLVRLWSSPTGWIDAAPATLRINMNTATEAELRLLPGVGAALAGKIVADRTAFGPFESIGELDRVKGIGKRTINKLAPFITADAEDDEAPLH